MSQPTPEVSREISASLLFADVSGFTALSERLAKRGRIGAEELTDVVNGVFGALLDMCRRYGGDVLKFGGDALLVMFPREGHEQRAAAAAIGMQAAMRDFRRLRTEAGNVTLRMSVGIDSGPVHLFLAGQGHSEVLVAGPVASGVVTHEATAQAGEILISAGTAAALPEGLVSTHPELGYLLRVAPAIQETGPLLRRAGEDARRGLPSFMHDADAGEGEHRTICVGFVQGRGIDDVLDRGGPGAVATALDALVTRAQQACDEHGVSFFATDVDKSAVKIILVTGAPTASTEDADRLLLAAREIVALDSPLQVRAGANRGQAYVGPVGDAGRRTVTVMGDAVNLAARVMGKAGAREVLATDTLLEHARTPFQRTPLEPFPVKGKTILVEASVVGEVGAEPLPEPEALHAGPLVGREAELAVIDDVIAAARTGDARALVLTGEPGIGKSRLLQALIDRADGLTVLRVEASPYATASPYFVMRAPLRGLIGMTARHDEEAVTARLRETVLALAPELEPWLPLLALPFGVDLPPTPETAAIAAEFVRERRQEVVTRLLSALLPDRGALLVVEDAHWLDEASSQLLAWFVGHAASIAACITERPTPVSSLSLPDDRGVTRIELEPLGEAESRAIVVDAAREGIRLRPGDHDELVRRSHGNPLFLRELLSALRAGESIDALPDTIEALLTARVDTLPPDDRALLRHAAVLGQIWRTWLLQELEGLSAPQVSAAVRRLSDFLMEAGPGRVRFRHTLIREAAYGTLSFRRRRELHSRAGDLVERLAGDNTEEVAELLSLHFHEAHRFAASWQWSRLAGEHAMRLGAPGDAAVLFGRALDAGRRVPDIPAGEGSVVAEHLADCCELAGRYQEARDAYAVARRLARGDVVRMGFLCYREGWIRQQQDEYSQALAWYTRGEKVLEGDNDPAAAKVRAKLHVGAGLSRLRQSRYEDALVNLRRGAREAELLGDRDTQAHAYYLLDWALTDLGRPEQRYREEALPIYEELGDNLGQANVLNNLGINALYEGRWDEAIDCFERSSEHREKVGDVLQMATTSLNMVEVLVRQGHAERAEALTLDALEVCRSVDRPLAIGQGLINLGHAQLRAGRYDEAEVTLAEARAAVAKIGADRLVIEADVLEAERRVLSGDADAAELLAGETLAAADGVGFSAALSSLHRIIGQARAQKGDLPVARAALEAALAAVSDAETLFEEALAHAGLAQLAQLDGGDAEPHAERARELLTRLGAVGALPLRFNPVRRTQVSSR